MSPRQPSAVPRSLAINVRRVAAPSMEGRELGAASLPGFARILRPGRFCGERVRVAFSVVRQSLWPAPSEPVGKRRRSQPKPSCAILRGKGAPFFRHPGYHLSDFPQPFAENHFGLLFLCGNIRHDTPRNSSFSPAARSPRAPFANGPSPARSCRSLFPYLLYLLFFLFLAHSSIFRN